MKWQQNPRPVWRVALTLVLTAELSGCLSVRTTRTKATGPAGSDGSLDVAVYDTPSKARAGVLTSGIVSLDLGRLDKGQPEKPVQSSTTPASSFGSLAPGEYRLHLKAAAPESSGAASGPTITQESIKVAAGETVHTRVILKEFPYRAVGGAVLIAGGAVGIAYAIANSLFRFGKLSLSQSRAPRTPKSRKR